MHTFYIDLETKVNQSFFHVRACVFRLTSLRLFNNKLAIFVYVKESNTLQTLVNNYHLSKNQSCCLLCSYNIKLWLAENATTLSMIPREDFILQLKLELVEVLAYRPILLYNFYNWVIQILEINVFVKVFVEGYRSWDLKSKLQLFCELVSLCLK